MASTINTVASKAMLNAAMQARSKDAGSAEASTEAVKADNTSTKNGRSADPDSVVSPVKEAPQSSEKLTQREQVKAIYEAAAPDTTARTDTAENAREQVKQLYEQTTLEETQAVQATAKADAEIQIAAEQARVAERAKLQSAMARDKAAAQEARIMRSRQATRDRIHLNTQRNFQEHFESFALARDMIALKDQTDDRARSQAAEQKAVNRTRRSDIQKTKQRGVQSTRVFQERAQKQEAAVAKRLDIITPGSFETPPSPAEKEQPTVQISKTIQQRHQFEINPSRQVEFQSQRAAAEDSRVEADIELDQALEGVRDNSSRTTESVRETLEALKEKAAEGGLVTLNSESQAQRAVEDVLDEARLRPEQAIQSQSQVSLQAALKVLQ